MKKLTAEVAEHAEANRPKGSRPGSMGKSSPISDPSRKVKTANGLSENDLCTLCFLFGHPLIFIHG